MFLRASNFQSLTSGAAAGAAESQQRVIKLYEPTYRLKPEEPEK